MSFTPSPSFSESLSVTNYIPVYKDCFTFHGLPCTLVSLTQNGDLVYLQSGYTEADSVLGTDEQRPVKVHLVKLQLKDKPWVTVLDVVPSKLVYAVVNQTGALVFFQLLVTMSNFYTVSILQTGELNTFVKKAVSLCFAGKRYFLLQGRHGDLEFYGCDTVTYEILPLSVEQEEHLMRLLLQDYNTENNIIGFKHNVCYYDCIPMGRVPPSYKLLSVFGTTCDAYQMLVWNKDESVLEWWRWTGSECEAVILPSVPKVKGSLLWV